MRLDAKDRKILYELDYSARKPLSEIAGAVGLPKQSVSYRVKALEKNGVIRRYTVVVNSPLFGYFVYRIFLRFQNITSENEEELVKGILAHKNVVWAVSTSGRWDMQLIVLAKNNMHFGEILISLKKQIGPNLKEYIVSLGRGGFHFGRKYLSENPEVKQAIFGFDVEQQKIDETDFGMLKLLAQDSSLSLRELAARLKLSPNGAKKRLEGLEKRGIIQFYRTWMDYEKLGRKFFKSVITLSDWSEKLQKSFISFCNEEPSIVYLVLCSGSSDMEIEAETLDETEFRALMVRFRNKFKDVVKDYEILNIYKEHKLIYFPFEKFEDI